MTLTVNPRQGVVVTMHAHTKKLSSKIQQKKTEEHETDFIPFLANAVGSNFGTKVSTDCPDVLETAYKKL